MHKYFRLKRRLPTMWHRITLNIGDNYATLCGLAFNEKDPELASKDYKPYPFEFCTQCARKEKNESREQ